MRTLDRMTKVLAVAVVVIGIVAGTVHAADAEVVAIPTVFCHNEKNNYTGYITDMITGTGMNGNGQDYTGSWPTNMPSSWTATTSAYQAEWQSGALLDSGVSINSKIGWAIFDLGSVYTLDTFYIWNVRENSGRYTKTFNVYVAEAPTAAPTHGPTSGGDDYDFSSGGTGWTLINTGAPLNGTFRGDQTVDISGNSGRYVAVEILFNNGDGSRVGLAEVGITIIPPPEGTVVLIR
ncbi:MAG: hypothetical protein HN919_14795 [Verrucomicrobia bacterium]|nr:hypothetical protein [Verrucomicrobiota bacterium]MBT7067566.1 hypothetical protein [Verrucomicrobiota bacterium]MBT7698723.1 hypothetical protein [Verrucomicrobiota bacterium]